MPQPPDFAARIARLQAVLKEHALAAVVLESGPGMLYFTGVRWGRSERTFAVVITQKGGPFWVLPGFEEMRARELIRPGDEIRIWEEDESPYQGIVDGLKARGIVSGTIGIDEGARFFVFDGIRKVAQYLKYQSAVNVLKGAGMQTP
jgi:Xaa-Pro dipeptidase